MRGRRCWGDGVGIAERADGGLEVIDEDEEDVSALFVGGGGGVSGRRGERDEREDERTHGLSLSIRYRW